MPARIPISAAGEIGKKHDQRRVYYVYALCDSQSAFYIGKGKGNRINGHEAEARRGGKDPRHCKIRSMISRGEKVIKRFLFTELSEEEAFEKEIDSIAAIGRNNLLNCTDGGEGPSGRKSSPEWIEAARIRMRGTSFNRGRRQSKEEKDKRATSSPRAMQTHCKRGHEFTKENTLTESGMNGRSKRKCIACKKLMNDNRKAILAKLIKPPSIPRTHCHKGHDLSEAGIYRVRHHSGRIVDVCRVCKLLSAKESLARIRSEYGGRERIERLIKR